MPPKGNLDWLVEDSEDECGDEYIQPPKVAPLPLPPPHQLPLQASDISEFTVTNTRPPLDKTSSISQFTNDRPGFPKQDINSKGNVLVPATATTTASTSSKVTSPPQANTTDTTVLDNNTKPARPRPRPAYKGPVADLESIETIVTTSVPTSSTTASRVASALNTAANSGPSGLGAVSESLNLDTPFPIDIAERAKMRRRQATYTSADKTNNRAHTGHGPKTSSSDAASSSSLSRKAREVGTVIELLSSSDVDDDRRRPPVVLAPASSSLSGRTTILNTSDPPQPQQSSVPSPTSIPKPIPFPIPPLPRRSDITTLPPSDPPSSTALTSFDHLFPRNVSTSTPPSSPVGPRQAKRRKIVLDDDEAFDPSISEGAPAPKSKKREGREKEKKPRERKDKDKKAKAKEPTGEDASAGVSVGVGVDGSASEPKKRTSTKTKGKESHGTKEPEYKSKEFIDTSDDDLDFLPSAPKVSKKPTSTSASTSTAAPASVRLQMTSVPASVQASVPPSIAISDKSSTGARTSLLRTPAPASTSASVSVLPSAAMSVPPSVSVSERPSVELSNNTDPPRAPASSPVIEFHSNLQRKEKKRKRPSTVLTDDEAGSSTTGASANVGLSTKSADDSTQPKKRTKKDKKSKANVSPAPEKPANEDINLDNAQDTIIVDNRKSQSKRVKKSKVGLSEEAEDTERSVSKSPKENVSDKDKEKVKAGTLKPTETSVSGSAPPLVPAKPKTRERKRKLIASDGESDEDNDSAQKPSKSPKGDRKAVVVTAQRQIEENKENESQPPKDPVPNTPSAPAPKALCERARSSTAHTVPSGRRDSVSHLLRRVSSKMHQISPLGSPSPSSPSLHSPLARSYASPLARSSRSALSRIAPLHPNRKEPPPPPPKPPAPKKSKKMLEMEERWEEELAESIEGWACLPEEERKAMWRAKRDAELGYED